MKKLLLILLVILIIFTVGIYLFIPAKINISSSAVVRIPDIAAERYIIDENKWGLWWGYGQTRATNGDQAPAGHIYHNRGYAFRQTGKFYKSVDIEIQQNTKKTNSKLVIISLAVDSTGIEWKTSLAAGNNPYTRVRNYFEAKHIKENMDEVLGTLKTFFSKTENVYGISIEKNRLKDTLYVSSKQSLAAYPSLKEIYALIDQVKTYISRNGTQATGSPIYNVTQMDKGRYQLMAAIPTNRALRETHGFSMKYMVKGSFMITEVLGGENAVHKASESMQQYFQDYRKTSMAMNFAMLVTDRILQPDSSKWITKLCMPVY